MKNKTLVLLFDFIMVILLGFSFANAAYAKSCPIDTCCTNCQNHKQDCCKDCCKSCTDCKDCWQCCDNEKKCLKKSKDCCLKKG